MPGDWMQEFNSRMDEDRKRKQDFSDEYRKSQITQYMGAANNMHKALALLTNPDTLQPLPGKEAQAAQIRQQLSKVDSYIQKLYDPNFNAQSGMVNEDPLHKLTDKLHLTKAPEQPLGRKPAQQLQDLQAIQSKYAIEPSLLTPDEQKKKAKIDAGLELPVGGDKPAHLSDFGKYLAAYAKKLGKDSTELSAEELSDARNKWMTSGRAQREKLVPDPESETGYATIGYDAAGNETYRVRNVVPPRGAQARETTQTDPFGVTTTTVSKPIFPQTAAPAPKSEAKKPKLPGQQIKDLKAMASKFGQGKQLDVEGHIPASAHVNTQLREAANNLLDGMSVKDLQVPEKDKTAAQNLAREYGWAGQGMFTPRDRLLVRESQAILTQFSRDPALAVLDDPESRVKLMQVLANPEKRGMVGQTLQVLTAGALTPAEQQFVTLYNQAVGRISGLSQLVRSGRPTEATIERLKTELPNPATTSSAEHARQKFAQLQNEIDIALQKGQFATASGDIDEIVDALKHEKK